MASEPQIMKKIKPNNLPKPLVFNVLAKYKKARAAIMTLPHGDVCTPVYMPVGTKGAMKGITYKEMEDMGCRLLLGNTYHLAYKPGGQFLERVGGLHNFVNWPYNILTDSGGFQMVSLSKLCEITEEGVQFQSPYDQSLMKLKPEDSIKEQNQIGGDIIMALDDVVQTTTQGERMKVACERTIRWIDRNIEAHNRKDAQNLFPIVQGGVDRELRDLCLDALIGKDANGYAIGGLAGGEDKEDFWRVVAQCTSKLPEDKPRYLMGVGYPVDVVVCSCLGVDMFDCVFSTRTARFGSAFSESGFLKLKNAEFAQQLIPIQEGCECQTCKKFTRSYLHYIAGKQESACHYVSIHNVYYLIKLMKDVHQAIIDGNLEDFVNKFLVNWFQKEKQIPDWVINALKSVEIEVRCEFK